MEKYDVIIVGAGPAGLFAAYELITKNNKLKVDGIVGELTLAAINKLVGEFNSPNIYVLVTGGIVNVRSTNSILDLGNIIFRAKRNEKYKWLSTSAQNGWYEIYTDKGRAWISNKYSKIINE